METATAPKWRYRTVKAKANSYAMDETPEHRFEYKVRTDDLTPHDARKEFQARCSCKWGEQRVVSGTKTEAVWHLSKTKARLLGWLPHLREALKQGQLC